MATIYTYVSFLYQVTAMIPISIYMSVLYCTKYSSVDFLLCNAIYMIYNLMCPTITTFLCYLFLFW